MVNRERAHTFIGLITALAVLTILGGAALSGGNAHFSTIGRVFGEYRVAETATGRLEELTADDAALVTGEREFETPEGMKGTETIKEVLPGLLEIRVRVSRPGVRSITLTTLAARGGRR